MMLSVKVIKKEISLQVSKIITIRIKKGICKGNKLYGNLFYNRRAAELSKEEKFFKSIDLTNKVVIDVGAQYGIYSIYYANRVGNQKVYSFEPNPLNYYFLIRNLKINRVENVIPFNAGLSDQEGKLEFFYRKHNTATGTFDKNLKKELTAKSFNNNGHVLKKTTVPVMTIDAFTEKHNLNSVDFVKVDTEGFEFPILQGMKNTISKFNPNIYFEIHGVNNYQKHKNLEKIYNFLRTFNYRVKGIDTEIEYVTDENIKNFNRGRFISYPV